MLLAVFPKRVSLLTKHSCLKGYEAAPPNGMSKEYSLEDLRIEKYQVEFAVLYVVREGAPQIPHFKSNFENSRLQHNFMVYSQESYANEVIKLFNRKDSMYRLLFAEKMLVFHYEGRFYSLAGTSVLTAFDAQYVVNCDRRFLDTV